jgi:hypothetical protein
MKLLNKHDLAGFNHNLFGASFFPHNFFQDPTEMSYQFLTIPNKGRPQTLTHAHAEIYRWLDFLSNNKIGAKVRSVVDQFWGDAVANIESFSSFNIHIEGNIPVLGINKKRMFSHIHPTRQGKDYHNALTYITPIYLAGPVQESFRYADYNEIGVKTRSEEQVFAGCSTRLEYGQAMATEFKNSDQYPGLVWQDKTFPDAGEMLRIRFNAARYVHSVENYCNNVYAIAVFNDVEFVDPVGLQEMEFTYL